MIGSTGKFPDGKIHPADEGELSLGVAHDNEGYVFLNFGTPVKSIAMPQEQAINFARLILNHAGVSKVEIEFWPKK
jgi:hypothetical protein